MATLRELKSRIGSVASTQKTTSAMKMISSAKLRKAALQLNQLTPYSAMVREVISHLLVTDGEFSSPLIEQREPASVAVVALGSDDGLCGAFNINIFKRVLEVIKEAKRAGARRVTLIPMGRKLTKAALKLQMDGVEVKTVELNTRNGAQQLQPFTAMLVDGFTGGEFDRVEVVYMHYRSTSRQSLECSRLLPVSVEALAGQMDARAANSPCLFEPSAAAIFRAVLPLFIRATVQNIYGHSAASEQATRVMAMQTASDNAAELLDALNLEYNKLRQQGITTELLDILGGQVDR